MMSRNIVLVLGLSRLTDCCGSHCHDVGLYLYLFSYTQLSYLSLLQCNFEIVEACQNQQYIETHTGPAQLSNWQPNFARCQACHYATFAKQRQRVITKKLCGGWDFSLYCSQSMSFNGISKCALENVSHLFGRATCSPSHKFAMRSYSDLFWDWMWCVLAMRRKERSSAGFRIWCGLSRVRARPKFFRHSTKLRRSWSACHRSACVTSKNDNYIAWGTCGLP